LWRGWVKALRVPCRGFLGTLGVVKCALVAEFVLTLFELTMGVFSVVNLRIEVEGNIRFLHSLDNGSQFELIVLA